MNGADSEIPPGILADMNAMLGEMYSARMDIEFIHMSDAFFKGVVMPVMATPQPRFNAGEAWRRIGKKRGRR